MTATSPYFEVPPESLRWRLDPASLAFETTAQLTPLDAVIGQERGLEALGFGMDMLRKGYNVFVTGDPGHGRLSAVKKLLQERSKADRIPDDLCYVNNFKRPEAPVLLRFKAGLGSVFKKDVHEFLERLKKEIPQLFESEEYIARKNEIIELHEKKVMEFYKAVEEKVKNTGLAMVRMEVGPYTRPDVLPVVDGEPKRIIDLEAMVANGRFPKDEFERLRAKRAEVKEDVDHIVQEVRDLQKEVDRKLEDVDKIMFRTMATDLQGPLREAHQDPKVRAHLEAMVEHMVDNLEEIKTIGAKPQGMMPGMPFSAPSPEAVLHPYDINLLVDNAEQAGPPVVIESYPTYRNLFGGVDRVVGPYGGWQTDFSKITAGAFVKANGGYLVLNLMDAIMEPGVWQTLKRSLKTESIEIQTYDPFYFISGTGLKPEPIDMEVKVVVLGDERLYQLLRYYDQDLPKIFKVRADFSRTMDKTGTAVTQMARFIAGEAAEHKLRPFTAGAVAVVVEHAVRMAGRVEKLSTAFPLHTDLLCEADLYAKRAGSDTVQEEHAREALAARIGRLSRIQDILREMIARGSLFVDVDGAAVGQVNGLAVYSMGGHAFGMPSRITATTAMGREGIINIEREADLSGPIHSKGMLILAGYLRRRFAQDRPLSLTASIAFEQAYSGVDGDSASSTELYALLSSLSGVPLRQDVAVTGSVNQMGRVQPIGGVNEKIEGFFLCCKDRGFTGMQGVMIPKANLKDLMLREEVIEAVREGQFHIWAVASIDEGVEVLTGVPAGERGKDGKYPEGSVNALADARLRQLAEGLRDFAQEGEKDKKDKSKKAEPKKDK
ncbi:Lon protease family protein [Fundidesulfovibrio agrisoli]|uniref:Lon protease family protein n=1 Tax=Fundidesulfovibrio agrisoli TaxID=2922717 RepID=UPI001FAD5AAD|nr:ATP-binding protein [Fundidesulfovibrio agrisoli]